MVQYMRYHRTVSIHGMIYEHRYYVGQHPDTQRYLMDVDNNLSYLFQSDDRIEQIEKYHEAGDRAAIDDILATVHFNWTADITKALIVDFTYHDVLEMLIPGIDAVEVTEEQMRAAINSSRKAAREQQQAKANDVRQQATDHLEKLGFQLEHSPTKATKICGRPDRLVKVKMWLQGDTMPGLSIVTGENNSYKVKLNELLSLDAKAFDVLERHAQALRKMQDQINQQEATFFERFNQSHNTNIKVKKDTK